MTSESAVQFETERRIHVGLAVSDVGRSAEFYATLLRRQPTKARPGYAKFEVADPPVNLTLHEVAGPIVPSHPASHFGVQVKSTPAVDVAAAELAQAGFPTDVQQDVTCCYAVQHKVWATDPDGHRWEVYVVLNDAADQQESTASDCCRPASAKIQAAMTASPEACCDPAAASAACSCADERV